MKLKKTMLLIFIIILISLRCDTTEPPPNKASLSLTLEDVSCTEAWLQLKLSNVPLPSLVTLYKNGAVAQNNILCYGDTLLYVDSLLPNQTYTFQISSIPQSGGQYPASSNKATSTTLDSTSHNFIWEIETIGDYGSYALDVAVINENDIWLVGQFYERFGSDTVYNAAHWDGIKWELILIPVKAFGGHFSRAPLRAIFCIRNELWVIGDAGGYAHLKNNNWSTEFNDVASATTNKIWGPSVNRLYFVGPSGAITYYDGQSFQKMESNTDVNITDIYGTLDGKEIWACGWNDSDGNSVLLRLNGNKWEKIYEKNVLTNNLPYNSFLSSLWIDDNKAFFLTGIAYGIVKHSIVDKRMAIADLFNRNNFAYRIRGNAVNDLFLAGDAGMVWHFNGTSWRQYLELFNQNSILRSVSIKGNIVIAAGLYFSDILSKALVIKGKR